jgi:hypothetical protein
MAWLASATVVSTALVAALAVSAVTTLGLAVAAWRTRDSPGALPFVGLMGAVTVYSAGYLVGLTVAPGGRVLWEQVHWLGIVVVPLGFLAFALDYLGHDEWLRPAVIVAGVPAVCMLALVWTNHWHGLVFTEQSVVYLDGLAVLTQDFGPAYWAFFLYAYTLILVGSSLLVRLAVLSEYLYLDQSALLLVGVAVPLLGNALSVFQVPPVPGFDLTPVAFTVTGVAFGNALFRYRLFDLVPATWQLGRETVAGALEEPVVIVDTDRTVIYLNDEAAGVFEVSPQTAVGASVSTLVDADAVDFEAPDALGELDTDGRTYEVRASAIADRHETLLGHTLVFNDITERKQRERTLQKQRDELRRLDRLNAVIRSVNQSLIDAETHEAVVETVTDQLTDSDLYDAAWTVDGTLFDAATLPDAEPPRSDGGVVVEGAVPADGSPLPAATDAGADPDELRGATITASSGVHGTTPGDSRADRRGLWTTVPLVSGQTVFGLLILFTAREDAFGERELAVLDELGESIGHAIQAAHTDHLLLSDATVELEFVCESAVLAAASGDVGCTITADGLAPAGDGSLVTYCHVDGAEPEPVAISLDEDPRVESPHVVDAQVCECRLSGGSLMFPLREFGADIESVRAEGGQCVVTAHVSAEVDVRRVVERVQSEFPDADLHAKRPSGGAVDDTPALESAMIEDLTDRQRETLEVAYSSGYFEWPRDATAEDVAASLDIASPTLHNHLRKAQNTLLGRILDETDRRT